jgi:hypothetical protein
MQFESLTLKASLYWNFVFMAVCFGANHGAVASVIALASTFNPALSSYSVAVLYSFYVVTAMFAGLFSVCLFLCMCPVPVV